MVVVLFSDDSNTSIRVCVCVRVRYPGMGR
jgi:hypothetical protein